MCEGPGQSEQRAAYHGIPDRKDSDQTRLLLIRLVVKDEVFRVHQVLGHLKEAASSIALFMMLELLERAEVLETIVVRRLGARHLDRLTL